MPVCDETGGEAEEGFVDVVSPLPADAKTSEAVQPGDGALDHPTVNTEAGSVRDTAAGDDWFDALRPDEPTVLVVVVAAVAEEDVGPPARPADEPGNRWDLRQER